jgi:dolichyl-phosphooligosaccharide-protein glycotransferase
MTMRSPLWVGLAIALVTIVLAVGARLSYDVTRTADPDTAEWVSIEADSFYHMRRLDRLKVEGWPVAGTDTALDFPDGAQIPWPPYYTMLLGALSMSWLPEEEVDRRLQVEQFVSSITVLFGVLSVLMALWSARLLAGDTGAAVAGPCAALALCSVVYSSLGNGDHHAFVACLHAGLLAGLTWLLASDGLDCPRRAMRSGVVLGVLAGFGIGSWVAFLPYVVAVDLMLGVLLFVHAAKPIAGLARFGFSFHLAGLATLAYASLTSPWLEVDSWMVVNLSYFHLFFLGSGALVFVPLLLPGVEGRLRKRYPLYVFVSLVALFALLLATGGGPGAGLREAFAWVSGEDKFMASIQESRSFFTDMGRGWDQLLLSLGWGLVILPLAWSAALVACWRGKRALLPWVVAAPLLLLQALSQLRFAEALVVPLAVLVGWGVGTLISRLTAATAIRQLGGIALALVLGIALQQPGIAEIQAYRKVSESTFEATELQASYGSARRMADWLRPQGVRPGMEGVLSTWGLGHLIEWVADRPTVATNFGSYLGESSYSFPARALLSEDDRELERLLEERQIGYLMLTSRVTENLPDMIARVEPALLEEYLVGGRAGWNGALRAPWFRTALARLLLGASSLNNQVSPPALAPPGFLRLVHVAREQDPAPGLGGLVSRSNRGWIWERVEGALLVAEGEPGEEFGVTLEVHYPKAGFRLTHVDRVTLDSTGRGSLRVPYATRERNGDGRTLPGASYWIGNHRGALEIQEADVLSGAEINLR